MIVVHFDVLSSPSETTITRSPCPEGMRLWRVLFEAYRGRMVVTADVGTSVEVLSEWLKRENIKPSFIHVATDFVRDGLTPRANALWWVNTNLGTPHWYVDTDADTCAHAVRMGIPTLLMAVPVFQRPEWHDSQPIRSWDAIVDEIESQTMKRNEMAWGDE